MGRPQSVSFDSVCMYPALGYLVPYLSWVHPNWIPMACIGCNLPSLLLLTIPLVHPWAMFAWLALERILDCLDGEIARVHQKTSQLGHYLDKYSDVLFRIGMVSQCSRIAMAVSSASCAWWCLVMGTIWCPLVYVLDGIRFGFRSDWECNRDGLAIYVEDNASILCVALPLCLAKL